MAVLMYKDPVTGEWKPSGSSYGGGSTFATMTMEASKWSGNTYSFEDEFPHSKYNVSIEVANTATVEEFEAFGEAMICGSADSNVATALNGAPTVDIPIVVGVTVR